MTVGVWLHWPAVPNSTGAPRELIGVPHSVLFTDPCFSVYWALLSLSQCHWRLYIVCCDTRCQQRVLWGCLQVPVTISTEHISLLPVLCPHRLTRETARPSQGRPHFSHNTHSYKIWWFQPFISLDDRWQCCTITLSTLLRKPYKCHSAEVYALRDSAAPESSRRENMCAGPGLALTLYLGHWHLDTQTMLQCSPPRAVWCNAKWIISFRVLRGFFAKEIMNRNSLLRWVLPPWPGQTSLGMVQLYSYHRMSLGGRMGRWDQREKSDPTSTRSRQTMVRGNGSPGVILQTRRNFMNSLDLVPSYLHYRS